MTGPDHDEMRPDAEPPLEPTASGASVESHPPDATQGQAAPETPPAMPAPLAVGSSGGSASGRISS